MANESRGWLRFTTGALALILAGCGNANPFTMARNPDGKPTVWECTAVQMSSPPKYACIDGKTYTAFQLHDFRMAPENSARTPAR